MVYFAAPIMNILSQFGSREADAVDVGRAQNGFTSGIKTYPSVSRDELKLPVNKMLNILAIIATIEPNPGRNGAVFSAFRDLTPAEQGLIRDAYEDVGDPFSNGKLLSQLNLVPRYGGNLQDAISEAFGPRSPLLRPPGFIKRMIFDPNIIRPPL